MKSKSLRLLALVAGMTLLTGCGDITNIVSAITAASSTTTTTSSVEESISSITESSEPAREEVSSKEDSTVMESSTVESSMEESSIEESSIEESSMEESSTEESSVEESSVEESSTEESSVEESSTEESSVMESSTVESSSEESSSVEDSSSVPVEESYVYDMKEHVYTEYNGSDSYNEDKSINTITSKAGKYAGVKIKTSAIKNDVAGLTLTFQYQMENVANNRLGIYIMNKDEETGAGVAIDHVDVAPGSSVTGINIAELSDNWYEMSIDLAGAFASYVTDGALNIHYVRLSFVDAQKGAGETDASLCNAAKLTIKDCKMGKALTSPVISLENNVVSWNAVANADKYEVYINHELKSSQTTTSYTVNETEYGSYTISVVAFNEKDIYLKSLNSNLVTYKLLDPNAEANDLSNALVAVDPSITLTEDTSISYAGSKSIHVVQTNKSQAFKLPLDETLKANLADHDLIFYVKGGTTLPNYMHLSLNYKDSAGQTIGSSGTVYIPFKKNHAAQLGSVTLLENAWYQCVVPLDDATYLYNGSDVSNIDHLRFRINDEACDIYVDDMSIITRA